MNSTLNEQALGKRNPVPPAHALAAQSDEVSARFESGKAVMTPCLTGISKSKTKRPSQLKKPIVKSVDPELAGPPQKNDPTFNTNKTSIPNPPDKHVVQIRFERELPLPVAIAHQLHETRVNAFRSFGINE